MDTAKEISYLNSLVTENKKQKIEQVLRYRTRYITVVLENILQSHNASAIVRSCDIFGIQDVHTIGKEHPFNLKNTIAKGAEKWIDRYHYSTTFECIELLKKKGYCIVATMPHKRGYTLQDLPLHQKTAIMFGTEAEGLTDQALSLADEYITIPMYGFTDSFNISVSVAICLYQLMNILRQSQVPWQLDKEGFQEIQLRWLKQVLHMIR